MHNNVLVLTDNIFMLKSFHDIVVRRNKDYLFSYGISKFSDQIEFQNTVNKDVLIYDLKQNIDIDKIINTFSLVLSVHSKQIFPPALVEKTKCINIHPGYNPINRGWYPQVFSILNNLEIGATIHEIDNQLDHGNIISRKFVDKLIIDTSETLYKKVLIAELELIEESLDLILNNEYISIQPENEGNLFLKKDFKKLLELDLNEYNSLNHFITKLRALTHGNHKNAFFWDDKTGKKVFVKISLEYDN